MNSIYCPINKNYYDISSTEGRTVLKKYIKSLIGSSQSEEFVNKEFFNDISNITTTTLTPTPTPEQHFLLKKYSEVILYIYNQKQPEVRIQYQQMIPKLANIIDEIIKKEHGYDLLVYLFKKIIFGWDLERKNIINVKDTFENITFKKINCNYEIFNLIINMLIILGYKFNYDQGLLTADIPPNMSHIKKMKQYLIPATTRNLRDEKRYIENHLPLGSSSGFDSTSEKIVGIIKEIDNRNKKFSKLFQAEDEAAAEAAMRAEAAATKIQALMRGKIARKAVAKMKASKEAETSAPDPLSLEQVREIRVQRFEK